MKHQRLLCTIFGTCGVERQIVHLAGVSTALSTKRLAEFAATAVVEHHAAHSIAKGHNIMHLLCFLLLGRARRHGCRNLAPSQTCELARVLPRRQKPARTIRTPQNNQPLRLHCWGCLTWHCASTDMFSSAHFKTDPRCGRTQGDQNTWGNSLITTRSCCNIPHLHPAVARDVGIELAGIVKC